ncbi:MAG TPA: hypothetical protein P5069_17385, partial [Candidatus Hydrogenedentes bacterium]|nr:hypothetical protein [Candidatus Hydrogenedentota bacterium]
MAGPEPPARPLMRLGMLWSAEAAQKVLSFLLFVAMSRGLTVAGIRRAVDYMERELADWMDIYFEQANVFSAIVGILGAKAVADP